MPSPAKKNKSTHRRPEFSLNVIGMMTGTSCDGLDASVLRFSTPDEWTSVKQIEYAYPSTLRKRVLEIQKPSIKVTLRQLLALDRDLSEFYAQIAKKIVAASIREKIISPKTPTIIANHGQTIAHHPDLGVTLQLGNPSRIAALTQLTTVGQFRDGDMAVGGQGAPFAPRYHLALAERWFTQAERRKGVAIHNLGGISNLSYINGAGRLLAFDTGPANVWIDAATEKTTRGKLTFDLDGKIAQQEISEGLEDPRAILRFLKHPYFKLTPPKSTGRDDFTVNLFESLTRPGPGLVATATLMTATSILDSYERWVIGKGQPLRTILFCGGGAKNKFLIKLLSREFAKRHGILCNVVPQNPQSIESEAFAYFGVRALMAREIGGTYTGAKDFGPPGHIAPGKNWNQVMAAVTRWSS